MSQLPMGWVETSLNELSVRVTKGTTPTTHGFKYLHSGVRFVKAESLVAGSVQHDLCAQIGIDAHAFLRRSQLEAGDVLFTIAGTLGRVGIVAAKDLPANTNQAVAIIRLLDISLAPFVAKYIESNAAQTVDFGGRGTGLQNLNLQQVGEISVRLPPVAEQRRIITKIESLSAKSKRARDHLDHVPRLVEKYKQAILTAAFRGDLTRDWRSKDSGIASLSELDSTRRVAWEAAKIGGSARGRYKESETYDWTPDLDLPDGWVWASVDQLVTSVQYGSSAKTSEDPGGVPVLRMGNIQGGRLDWTSLKYLPYEHSEFPDLLLEKGDLLFNRTNSAELVGKTAVFYGERDRASFASYLIRLKASGMNPTLLSAYINSPFGRSWVASVVNQQVGQANVNGTKLRRLAVPTMHAREQKELVRRIETAFAWIDRLASEATSARKMIDHLDQAILSKAFRGELVPQHPDDEPASVLLERIRTGQVGPVSGKRRGRRP